MTRPSRQSVINRRGCLIIAAVLLLAIALLAAIGLGLLGNVDNGKLSGLPVLG